MKINKFLTIGIASLVMSASMNVQARENHHLLDKLNPQKQETVQAQENKVEPKAEEEFKFNDNSRASSLLRVGLGVLSMASGKPAPIEISDISNIFTGSKSEKVKEEVKKEESVEKPVELKENVVSTLTKLRNISSLTKSSKITPS